MGGQSRKNDFPIQKKIGKEIRRSKYLFLQNITSLVTARFYYFLGEIIFLYNRINNKLKKIIE